ncbi:MAG: hypothetical protein K2J48_03670, partial [Muribaculaceae bacterium]|nr:hypothetical protein [Muribaculaceae bacterium]
IVNNSDTSIINNYIKGLNINSFMDIPKGSDILPPPVVTSDNTSNNNPDKGPKPKEKQKDKEKEFRE